MLCSLFFFIFCFRLFEDIDEDTDKANCIAYLLHLLLFSIFLMQILVFF